MTLVTCFQDEAKPSASAEDAEMKDDQATAATSSAPSSKQTKRKAPEPSSYPLPNLSRVTPSQLASVALAPESRYVPVRPFPSSSDRSSTPGGGIVLVRDSKPDELQELVELEVLKQLETPPQPAPGAAPGPDAAAAPSSSSSSDQDLLSAPIADVPPPFEWTDWE